MLRIRIAGNLRSLYFLTRTMIPTWDNWLIVSTDRLMSDFWELMFMINKMPKQDLIIKHYSQYTDVEYYTWCTIMSGINEFATLNNYDFTKEEIKQVYDLAQTRWWSPWKAWSRSEWWITVTKRWNTKFPTNKALLFTTTLLSDEFNAYMDKLGIVWVSINVDYPYWKDVRDNLILNGFWPFQLVTWHATCMMFDIKYKCIDSVTQNYTNMINIPMLYTIWDKDKIVTLNMNHNLRQDCHIVIMEKWLKQKDPVEVARLVEFKSNLEQAIALNSKIWTLSNNSTERSERSRQNNYNRAKLAIVNWMLS